MTSPAGIFEGQSVADELVQRMSSDFDLWLVVAPDGWFLVDHQEGLDK